MVRLVGRRALSWARASQNALWVMKLSRLHHLKHKKMLVLETVVKREVYQIPIRRKLLLNVLVSIMLVFEAKINLDKFLQQIENTYDHILVRSEKF